MKQIDVASLRYATVLQQGVRHGFAGYALEMRDGGAFAM
jgi:ABC-type uncharacterized transport system permease subunit